MLAYFEDEVFDKKNFTTTLLEKGEYDSCTFKNCILSDTHLSNFNFVECAFIDCDFSNANVANTGFKDVLFQDCKMLGLNFHESNPFLLQMRFSSCQLNHSSFYKMMGKGMIFNHCELKEVDFTAADLSGISFDGCKLDNATFEQTRLEKADFRNAKNFSIDPDINDLKQAKFTTTGLVGLLIKHQLDIEP